MENKKNIIIINKLNKELEKLLRFSLSRKRRRGDKEFNEWLKIMIERYTEYLMHRSANSAEDMNKLSITYWLKIFLCDIYLEGLFSVEGKEYFDGDEPDAEGYRPSERKLYWLRKEYIYTRECNAGNRHRLDELIDGEGKGGDYRDE